MLKNRSQANVSKHYDNKYFDWQKGIGSFGGWANQTKFIDYLDQKHTVIDFGCGGGYLLAALKLKRRIGIEVSAIAIEEARNNGIEVYRTTEECPDNIADVIISNNALEHTLRPLDEIRELQTKLKHDGLIIFVVPCENITYKYQPNDINHHLYSWSPMSIGNLFTEAGYDLIESQPYIHKWPPNYLEIAKKGRNVFEKACREYGKKETTWFQIRVIAKRPPNKYSS